MFSPNNQSVFVRYFWLKTFSSWTFKGQTASSLNAAVTHNHKYVGKHVRFERLELISPGFYSFAWIMRRGGTSFLKRWVEWCVLTARTEWFSRRNWYWVAVQPAETWAEMINIWQSYADFFLFFTLILFRSLKLLLHSITSFNDVTHQSPLFSSSVEQQSPTRPSLSVTIYSYMSFKSRIFSEHPQTFGMNPTRSCTLFPSHYH